MSVRPISNCMLLFRREGLTKLHPDKELIMITHLPMFNCLFFQTLFVAGNAFSSWAAAYAKVENQSDCWVCRLLPLSSAEGMPWIIHHFNYSDSECWFNQVTIAKLRPLSPSSHPGESPFDYSKTKKYIWRNLEIDYCLYCFLQLSDRLGWLHRIKVFQYDGPFYIGWKKSVWLWFYTSWIDLPKYLSLHT